MPNQYGSLDADTVNYINRELGSILKQAEPVGSHEVLRADQLSKSAGKHGIHEDKEYLDLSLTQEAKLQCHVSKDASFKKQKTASAPGSSIHLPYPTTICLPLEPHGSGGAAAGEQLRGATDGQQIKERIDPHLLPVLKVDMEAVRVMVKVPMLS